jgi:Leucine-rich repeat (LRR) protein
VLEQLPHLAVLDVSECAVGDLAWLRNLPRLEQLWLNLTELTDLHRLGTLADLRCVGLAGAVVVDASASASVDLSSLSATGLLQDIDLRGWRLGRPTWLAKLPNLRRANLARTDLSDTGVFRATHQLVDVDLSETPITSLAGLESSPLLRRLRLDRTRVSSLDPIRGATGLEELRLRDTGVTDLSAIARCTALQTLDLRGGPVFERDLRPLLELPRLELLLLDRHGLATDLLPALTRRHRVVFTRS